MDKKVIVTGVIGADVHAVGNKILTYALEEAGFKMKADKQDYDAVMTAVGEHLLEAFPFLEQRPSTALGKNDRGYVIQLKDMYATGIIDAYGKLLAACPEDIKERWLFDVVH